MNVLTLLNATPACSLNFSNSSAVFCIKILLLISDSVKLDVSISLPLSNNLIDVSSTLSAEGLGVLKYVLYSPFSGTVLILEELAIA